MRAIQTTNLDTWEEDPASAPFQDLLRSLSAVIKRQRASVKSAASSAQAASTAAAARVAICVLPFANMSGDQEQEYFSDGITEDIITDLCKVSALAVVSRNTAFTYKGKQVDVAQVARELKVGHVLEGSVRKAGGRVRITAQLVDASSNDHVWAERYDRDLNDIFALQEEISEAIVKALKLKLVPEERKRSSGAAPTMSRPTTSISWRVRPTSPAMKPTPAHRSDHPPVPPRHRNRPSYARAWALMAIGIMHSALRPRQEQG